MGVNVLLENDAFVSQLRVALSDGAAGLSDVPALLKCVIREDRWRSRTIKTGEPVEFDRFEAFVAAKPLEGLGADMALIERICACDKEALGMITEVTKRPTGRPQKTVNNIHNFQGRPAGTSASATIRQLHKKSEVNPEAEAAYKRVLAGEISPHRAMVELGYRKPTVAVPIDPAPAARLLVRHFGLEQTKALIVALSRAAGFTIETD